MCGPHHCLGRDTFASGPEILRRLLQLRQNASILEQGCAGHSPNSANPKHQITRHPWRTSPPLTPSLSFRYTQHPDGGLRAHQAGEEATKGVVQVPDLGPGKATYGSSSLYAGDQNRRIFLRSAKPVAAWVEREHQWPAEAVLSEGHRLVGALASLSEQSGSSAQRK